MGGVGGDSKTMVGWDGGGVVDPPTDHKHVSELEEVLWGFIAFQEPSAQHLTYELRYAEFVAGHNVRAAVRVREAVLPLAASECPVADFKRTLRDQLLCARNVT